MSYKELLLGCGHSREKRLFPLSASTPFGWSGELTTVDSNPECKPDFLFDLNELGSARCALLFGTNAWDEVHAYEVLEHIGRLGNVVDFFQHFGALWRMLKPNGYLCATVPSWRSIWAFGDPGHTRIISEASLVFLDQREYAKQLGKTSMSDYRSLLGDTNFHKVSALSHDNGTNFSFVLKAIK